MRNNWSALDNAAKIFPSAISRTETQVFRFSCELYEPIKPQYLQEALNATLEIFQTYRMILKQGMFWYYLEESDLEPEVAEETHKLCRDMESKKNKSLLFEVTYFHNRINLEVYHVLSDGTSAMNFLKTLVTKYLALYHDVSEPELDLDASHAQKKDDSYKKYYSGTKQKRKKMKKACKIQGPRYAENRLRDITGLISTRQLLELSHRYNTTLTVFLTACMLEVISQNVSLKEKKKPIVLSIPVNLRSYFPSESARNFFGTMYLEYDALRQNGDFESLLSYVAGVFETNLTKENLAQQLDAYSAVEHNPFAKISPLFLKSICLKWVYKWNMKKVTATVSNVGRITLPEEIQKDIRSFDVCSSTNKVQACICSFGDKLSISVTTPHVSSDIERCLFRKLTGEGLEVEVTTNLPEGGEYR